MRKDGRLIRCLLESTWRKIGLDVHLRPAEAFTVVRDGEGIEALVYRLATLKVELVARTLYQRITRAVVVR